MKLLGYVLALMVLATTLPTPPADSRPAATTAQGVLDPARLGMVIRDPWYDFGTDPSNPNQPNQIAQERMGQILAQTGVRWVRMEFFVEGGDAQALERNISRYDYFVQEVAPRHNLKILGLLSFGLIRDIDPLDKNRGLVAKVADDPLYGGGVNDYMRTWLDRARAVASRYPGQVAAYQILNEQNRVAGHNGAGVDAEVAARLHTKFYRFFKVRDRSEPAGEPSWRDTVPIVIGGLHPRGTTAGVPATITDRDYLRRYYTTEPFASYKARYGSFPLEGVGYHPYPAEIRLSSQIDAEVALIQARLDAVRAVLGEVGDAGRPFWISEIGYNAGYLRQDEVSQGLFLRAVFSAVGARPDVAAIFWFKYEDFPGSPTEPQLWGVVHIPFTISTSCPGGACYAPSGEPEYRRLAYLVYRELAGIPNERIFLPLVSR